MSLVLLCLCSTRTNKLHSLSLSTLLLSIVLIWVGLYDLLDLYTFTQSPLRDGCYLVGGMMTLLFTRGFYAMAYVYPPDDESVIPTPTPTSAWYFHLFTALRAMFSIVGQNMVWLGAWNLLEYTSQSTLWRECFFATAGMLLFILTNSFVPNSYIDEDEYDEEEGDELDADAKGSDYKPIIERIGNIQADDDDEDVPLMRPPPRATLSVEEPAPDGNVSLAFYVRTVLAMAAQITHAAGVWTLLDSYVFPLFLWRDIACCLGGLFLLVISGTLMQNAAITPIMTAMWHPEDDLTHDAQDDVLPSSYPSHAPPSPRFPRMRTTSDHSAVNGGGAADGVSGEGEDGKGNNNSNSPGDENAPIPTSAPPRARRYDPDTWSVISTMSTSARQWRSRRRRFVPETEEDLFDRAEVASLRRGRRDSIRSRDVPELARPVRTRPARRENPLLLSRSADSHPLLDDSYE